MGSGHYVLPVWALGLWPCFTISTSPRRSCLLTLSVAALSELPSEPPDLMSLVLDLKKGSTESEASPSLRHCPRCAALGALISHQGHPGGTGPAEVRSGQDLSSSFRGLRVSPQLYTSIRSQWTGQWSHQQPSHACRSSVVQTIPWGQDVWPILPERLILIRKCDGPRQGAGRLNTLHDGSPTNALLGGLLVKTRRSEHSSGRTLHLRMMGRQQF